MTESRVSISEVSPSYMIHWRYTLEVFSGGILQHILREHNSLEPLAKDRINLSPSCWSNLTMDIVSYRQTSNDLCYLRTFRFQRQPRTCKVAWMMGT